jgi:hypothetical protein
MSAGLALLTGGALAQNAGLPAPDTRAVLHAITENDSYAPARTDRWYTNGVRFGYSSPEAQLPGPVAALDSALARLFGPAQSRWGIGLGQNIYGPRDTRAYVPDPHDRPYAGYLYVEGSLDRRTANTLDRFTLAAGIVGPGSLGRKTQDIAHELIGSRIPHGWRYQMRDEATLNLGWSRIWRYRLANLPGGLEVDTLPSAEVALGTVAIYAQAGARLRFGQGLGGDFGTPRIRPGGGDTAAPLGQGFGWYVFGGGAGRVVGRDLFLDGSTWRASSPSVKRRNAVADMEAGGAVFWHNVRLSYTHDWRTEEFAGQKKWFTYGIATLSVAF